MVKKKKNIKIDILQQRGFLPVNIGVNEDREQQTDRQTDRQTVAQEAESTI